MDSRFQRKDILATLINNIYLGHEYTYYLCDIFNLSLNLFECVKLEVPKVNTVGAVVNNSDRFEQDRK